MPSAAPEWVRACARRALETQCWEWVRYTVLIIVMQQQAASAHWVVCAGFRKHPVCH